MSTPTEILVRSAVPLTDTEVIEKLADGTAERVADVLQKWADDAVANGVQLTAGQVDKLVDDTVERLRRAVSRSLSRRRSPGITLLAAATGSRNEASARPAARSTAATPAPAPVIVQNVLPEFVEVETEAVYDADGKMTGTKTVKQAVRQ